ncbi:oligosaccharyltransferase complex subunit ostc-A-like isoform X1 [Salvia splendens]|uniref:oligosaccharyltransferase complex subunit ostc-A-like isoform X1 n=1 Tax=Salvia splendens TaxID=180675 RepID=UPI001C255643|nr:oligosaccharyltransferase complex subunit ostc-A-like isoform X1 [Salvia splendens]
MSSAAAQLDQSGSIDPIFHAVRVLPFSFLRPPRLRLKLPSFSLPSAMTVYALILLTYFMVVSGFVYDVIVEPPGIGSTQDRFTGAVRPVVFMPGRVNGQYIIEGLSSGFMFVLGGTGIVLLDLALDKNRAKSVKYFCRICFPHGSSYHEVIISDKLTISGQQMVLQPCLFDRVSAFQDLFELDSLLSQAQPIMSPKFTNLNR